MRFSETLPVLRPSDSIYIPLIEGEGLLNVVLEAMAHSLPVMATTSGGLPTLIKDGETGYLVPVRDTGALAECIGHLLEHPDKRARLGESAREYVRTTYSWEAIVDDLEAVYAGVVSQT